MHTIHDEETGMDISPTFRAQRDCDGHAQIGLSRHALMGIRYEGGEGGAAPAGGTGAPGAAAGGEGGGEGSGQAGTQGTPGAPAPGAAAGGEGQQQGTAIDMTGWPQAAIDAYNKRDGEAKRYQTEAGDRRIQARDASAAAEGAQTEAQKALLRSLAPFLGLELPAEGEAADPAKLTQQLTAATEQVGGLSAENVLLRQAIEAKVDPAKLAYLEFQLSRNAEYTGLDRTAADYSAKVRASIDTLVAADRTLVQSGTAQASGPESFGGSNGGGALTQDAFNAMSMAEKNALYMNDKPTYDRLNAGVPR